METKISIHIETGDADLAERIGRALNGNLTERYEGAPGTTVVHPSNPEGLRSRPMAEEIYNDDRAEDQGNDQTRTAETATDPGTSTNSTGSGAAAGGEAPRDQKGVPFHTQFCGQAKEPFYASGKRSGQWKKKKGVTDEQYDAWYAEELAKLGGNDTAAAAEFNTGAAFGAGTQARQQEQPAAPQDTGGFMGWVSEKQAAGLITQDDIQQAYAAEGVQITDLFPPNDPHTIAGRIRGLYDRLAAKAGA